MTNCRILQTIRYTGLLMALALSGCNQDTGTNRAGTSTDDASLPPGRPMLAADSNKALGAASIKVTVKLSPALAKQAAAQDTVFIFARAAQGPRMPLAILRKQVRDLPVTVTLDDSLAMSPELKLSDFSEVMVGARISKSGSAMAEPGDLEGYSALNPAGQGSVQITIATVYTGKNVLPAGHPQEGAGTESAFMHPKTPQSSTLNIPPEVKAKWKSVELSITAAGGKEQRVRITIGDKVAVPNTALSLGVSAFVPAFMSDAGVVTSSSNKLDNPAVQLQLSNSKGKITEGWVFQSLPDFNSFHSREVSVRLLSAESR